MAWMSFLTTAQESIEALIFFRPSLSSAPRMALSNGAGMAFVAATTAAMSARVLASSAASFVLTRSAMLGPVTVP